MTGATPATPSNRTLTPLETRSTTPVIAPDGSREMRTTNEIVFAPCRLSMAGHSTRSA